MKPAIVKNAFVSVPMKDRPESEISEHIAEVVGLYKRCLQHVHPDADITVRVINVIAEGDLTLTKLYNYFSYTDFLNGTNQPEKETKPSALAYLAESIRRMELADVFIFGDGWKLAKGCLVEDFVRQKYLPQAEWYNQETLRRWLARLEPPEEDGGDGQ